MSRCNDYCCNHNCQQGDHCLARIERIERMRRLIEQEHHHHTLVRVLIARVTVILIFIVIAAVITSINEALK